MATIKVRWTVAELANVLTLFDRCKVYRSTAGVGGPYVEITTGGTRVPLDPDVVDYWFDDTAGASSYYYRIAYYHGASALESELSDPIQGTGGGMYLTVQDLRDAGWTSAQLSDGRATDLIEQAEAMIEESTGRWFYPRLMTIRVDGSGARVQPLRAPVIQLDTCRILAVDDPYEVILEADLGGIRVYNRHLTQGLTGGDDDREAPRLEWNNSEGWFYQGRQNVELTGWFGFTMLGRSDPVGETSPGSQVPLSKGRTPPLIKRAALLLVARYLPLPTDPGSFDDALRAGAVQKIKTRDQEITYAAGAGVTGAASGDAEIDRILGMYSAPLSIAIV